jgi:hypothetical protein
MKQADRNSEEADKMDGAIAGWQGKAGGEAVIADLTERSDKLSEANAKLRGTQDEAGEIAALYKKLDEAIAVRDAMKGNKTLFVNKYRSQVAQIKNGQASAERKSLS